MAAFNLTAQLNLRGPTNVRQIAAGIRRDLGSLNANINFKLDPAAVRNTTALNGALKNLNSSFAATARSATDATTAIRSFASSINSINIKNMPQQLNASATAIVKLNQASSKTQQTLAGAHTEMAEFGKQAGLAVRRFAAFTAVTSVIYSVTNSISQGVQAFIEYDKELVRLQQVTGESAQGLAQLQKQITGLSTSFGVSSKDLTNIALTLAQAGLSAKDTERSLKALALSSLAPSFDNMNETVEGSIALMRQFGISAGDLESALGSINAVAAKFAVESADIITAIQRTGSVFATASKGVSEGKDALNEFIAVFTSVRATTRESAETIATGLRTIFTRIQRGGTIDALKEFGVNLTDAEGKFVGAYKAVELLSQGLNKIDPRSLDFSRIVEELGGFRQIGKVIPLIQQFGTAQEALKVAQKGQGSLAKDAAIAQLSLANQIAKVREEFFALFREIGQSKGFQTVIRGALDLASAFIKIADSVKGVLPVLAVLTAFKGASALTQFAGGFFGAIKGQKKADGGTIRKFARGGLVPGSGNGDTVPAMLEPGEFVIRKKAVETIGTSNLQKMNRYAKGGPVKINSLLGRSGSASIAKAINTTNLEPDDSASININPKEIKLNDTDFLNIWLKGKKLAKQGRGQFKDYSGIDVSRENRLRLKSLSTMTKQQRQEYKKTLEPDVATGLSKLQSAEGRWGVAYEQTLINKLKGNWQKASSQSNYPIDIVKKLEDGSVKRLGEVKFRTNKTEDIDLISKLLRYRIDKKSINRYFKENKINLQDTDINLGTLDYFWAGNNKKQFYKFIEDKQKIKTPGFSTGGEIQKFKIGGRALGARSKFKELTSEEIDQLPTKDLIKYGKRLARNIFTTGGAGMAVGSEFIEVSPQNMVPELESSLVTYMGKRGFWREQISPFGKPSKQIQKINQKSGRQKALDKQIAQYADEVAAREQQWTKIRPGSSIDKYLLTTLKDPILSDYITSKTGAPLAKTFHETRLRQAVNKALEKYDDFDYSAGNIDKLVSGIANKKFSSGGTIQKFMAGGIAEAILGKVPTLSELVSGPFAANKQFAAGEKNWKQILSEILASQGIPYDTNSGSIRLDTPQGVATVSLKDAISPQQLKAAKFSSRVGAANIAKLTTLRDLIQARYVEGRGSVIESTRPRTASEAAAAQEKDLMFGAVGMLGKEYDRMPLRISKGITNPVDVVVSGRRLDPTVARSIDKGFSKTLDKTSKRAAKKVMIGQIIKDITGGNQLVLDFDRTLALGADKILSDPRNPKFSEFSDRTKVSQALQKSRLSGLGRSLAKLISQSEPDVKSSLLERMSVLTARPQNTLDLIQTWLASKGLPISKFTGVGGTGVTPEQIAQLKASLIPSGASFVDDDKRNIEAAEQKGIKSYLYKFGKKQESSDIASAKGILFQDIVERLGAPKRNPNKKSIDFPFGLGSAAKYFDGLPPNIPTDAKRTISSASDLTDNITNYLIGMGRATKVSKKQTVKKNLGGLIQKFAFGGQVEDSGFEQVKKRILAKYPQIDFRITKRKSGFGYMIQAGLSPDQRSQVNFASNLNDLPIVSDKIAKDILENYGPHIDSSLLKKMQKKKFAVGGSVEDTVPALLTPGEFVINKKAAQRIGYSKLHKLNKADKLQGYNKGGVVQHFADGGIPVRPDMISSSTIKIDTSATTALQNLRDIIQQLGLTGSETAKLLQNTNNISYKSAEKAAAADLARAKASGASINQIIAAEKALGDIRNAKNKDVGKRNILESAFSGVSGRSSGSVQQEIISEANTEAQAEQAKQEKQLLNKKRLRAQRKIKSKLESEAIAKKGGVPLTLSEQAQINLESRKKAIEKVTTDQAQLTDKQKEKIYERSTINATSRVTGIDQKTLSRSGIKAEDIRQYAQESMMDRKALAEMDKQYRVIRLQELQAAGKTAKEAHILIEQELRDRRAAANAAAAQRGVAGPGSGFFDGYTGTGTFETGFGGRGILGGISKGIGRTYDYAADTITNIRSRSLGGNIAAGFRGVSRMGGALAGSGGFYGSMALGMLSGQGENIFGSKTKDANTASKVAGFEAGTSTMAAGLATASSLAMIPGVGPFAAALTMGVTVVKSWSSAVEAGKQAVLEFEQAARTKAIEEAADKRNKAFSEFEKDPASAKNQQAVSDAISKENALNRENAAKRLEALKQKPEYSTKETYYDDFMSRVGSMGAIFGMGGYDPAGDRRNARIAAIGQESKDQARAAEPLAEATNRFIDSLIQTGKSLEEIGRDPRFSSWIDTIAEADVSYRTLINTGQLEEASKRKSTLTQEALTNANRVNMVAVLANAKAMEAADKAGKRLAVSFDTLANILGQSINRANFEADLRAEASNQTSAALRGESQVGAPKLRETDILSNPDVYTKDEFNNALQTATSSISDPKIRQQLIGGAQLQQSVPRAVTQSVAEALSVKRSTDVEEAKSKALAAAKKEIDANTNLSSDQRDELKNIAEARITDLATKSKENNKGKSEEVAVLEFTRELNNAQNILGDFGKNLLDKIKALSEFKTGALARFAEGLNSASKAAKEAQNYFKKARDIRTQRDMNLREVMTGVGETYEEKRSRTMGDIAGLAGGQTTVPGIKNRIIDLTTQRNKELERQSTLTDPKALQDSQKNIRLLDDQLRDTKEALDTLADSTELVDKAFDNLKNTAQLQDSRQQFVNTLLTNTPEEADKLNQTIIRLQRNLSGGLNNASNQRDARKAFNDELRRTGNVRLAARAGNTTLAEQRKQTLSLVNDSGFKAAQELQIRNQYATGRGRPGVSADEAVADYFKQQQLQVTKQMAIESGLINNPLVQQSLAAIQDRNADPAMKQAAERYLEAMALKEDATKAQGELKLIDSNLVLKNAIDNLKTSIDDFAAYMTGAVGRDPTIIGAAGNRMTPMPVNVAQPVAGRSNGGIVYASSGRLIDFQPKGTDTVPAMLSPGEFVINARSTAQHLPLLQAINDGQANIVSSGMSRGGIVYLADGGVAPYQAMLNSRKEAYNQRQTAAKEYNKAFRASRAAKPSTDPSQENAAAQQWYDSQNFTDDSLPKINGRIATPLQAYRMQKNQAASKDRSYGRIPSYDPRDTAYRIKQSDLARGAELASRIAANATEEEKEDYNRSLSASDQRLLFQYQQDRMLKDGQIKDMERESRLASIQTDNQNAIAAGKTKIDETARLATSTAVAYDKIKAKNDKETESFVAAAKRKQRERLGLKVDATDDEVEAAIQSPDLASRAPSASTMAAVSQQKSKDEARLISERDSRLRDVNRDRVNETGEPRWISDLSVVGKDKKPVYTTEAGIHPAWEFPSGWSEAKKLEFLHTRQVKENEYVAQKTKKPSAAKRLSPEELNAWRKSMGLPTDVQPITPDVSKESTQSQAWIDSSNPFYKTLGYVGGLGEGVGRAVRGAAGTAAGAIGYATSPVTGAVADFFVGESSAEKARRLKIEEKSRQSQQDMVTRNLLSESDLEMGRTAEIQERAKAGPENGAQAVRDSSLRTVGAGLSDVAGLANAVSAGTLQSGTNYLFGEGMGETVFGDYRGQSNMSAKASRDAEMLRQIGNGYMAGFTDFFNTVGYLSAEGATALIGGGANAGKVGGLLKPLATLGDNIVAGGIKLASKVPGVTPAGRFVGNMVGRAASAVANTRAGQVIGRGIDEARALVEVAGMSLTKKGRQALRSAESVPGTNSFTSWVDKANTQRGIRGLGTSSDPFTVPPRPGQIQSYEDPIQQLDNMRQPGSVNYGTPDGSIGSPWIVQPRPGQVADAPVSQPSVARSSAAARSGANGSTFMERNFPTFRQWFGSKSKKSPMTKSITRSADTIDPLQVNADPIEFARARGQSVEQAAEAAAKQSTQQASEAAAARKAAQQVADAAEARKTAQQAADAAEARKTAQQAADTTAAKPATTPTLAKDKLISQLSSKEATIYDIIGAQPGQTISLDQINVIKKSGSRLLHPDINPGLDPSIQSSFNKVLDLASNPQALDKYNKGLRMGFTHEDMMAAWKGNEEFSVKTLRARRPDISPPVKSVTKPTATNKPNTRASRSQRSVDDASLFIQDSDFGIPTIRRNPNQTFIDMKGAPKAAQDARIRQIQAEILDKRKQALEFEAKGLDPDGGREASLKRIKQRYDEFFWTSLKEEGLFERLPEFVKEQTRAGVAKGGTSKSSPSVQTKHNGGIIYANNGALVAAMPQGTDTVPAMLTPGEFVVNRESAQRYTPILHAINSGHFNRGGIVNYLANGGIVAPKYYAGAGPVKGSGGSGVAAAGGVFTNVAEMMSQAEKAIGQMVANTMNSAAEQMKQVFNKNIGEPLMQTVVDAGSKVRQAVEPVVQMISDWTPKMEISQQVSQTVRHEGSINAPLDQTQAGALVNVAVNTSNHQSYNNLSTFSNALNKGAGSLDVGVIPTYQAIMGRPTAQG